jgi:hypothetical protein
MPPKKSDTSESGSHDAASVGPGDTANLADHVPRDLLKEAVAALGLDPATNLMNEEALFDEFAAKYPLTAAAMTKWREDGRSGNARLKITARRHGHRRAGIAHSAEATDRLILGMTADQVEAILADPDLITEIV